jgi:hypothetical protein
LPLILEGNLQCRFETVMRCRAQHTPWSRQHQLSAKGVYWHADSRCPAGGKEDTPAADGKTAAA